MHEEDQEGNGGKDGVGGDHDDLAELLEQELQEMFAKKAPE